MQKSVDGILKTLELAPGVLADFVAAIPLEAVRTIRRPGFWSIERHLFHLAETQSLLNERLRRFRDEERPSFVPYLPGSGKTPPLEVKVSSIEEALDVFRDWRAKTIALARSLPDEVWKRVGTHPEYTSYSCLGLLRHIMMHDHWHMYRIEELWLTRDEYLTEVQ